MFFFAYVMVSKALSFALDLDLKMQRLKLIFYI